MNRYSQKEPYHWLVVIAMVLICFHLAQWVRYFYPDKVILELIVPLTNFLIVYLLIIYGFATSNLLVLKNGKKNSTLEGIHQKEYSDKVLQLIKKEKIYRNPELNLAQLSEMAGLPAYQMSHLINETFRMGFNEFLKSARTI